MQYVVYKTTNLRDSIGGVQKFYIGIHKTENPEIFDGYLGCGVYANKPHTYMYGKTPFQKAVNDFKSDSFVREILFTYDLREDAAQKEREIVNRSFLQLPYVYNVALGGEKAWYIGKAVYEFDLSGSLIKRWDIIQDLLDELCIDRLILNYYIYDKHPLNNRIFARNGDINIEEYSCTPQGSPKLTYLYNEYGKCVGIFTSRKECAEYLGLSITTVCNAISRNSLVNGIYSITSELTDVHIKDKRVSYESLIYYLYSETSYMGAFSGREVMKRFPLLSWEQFRDRVRTNNKWINGIYVSLEPLSNTPVKHSRKNLAIDVFTASGSFIKTCNSLKECCQQYGISSRQLRGIRFRERSFNDLIFRVHNTIDK